MEIHAYQYVTQTAQGFDTIYGLGHDAATQSYHVSILAARAAIIKDQASIDGASLVAARQYREKKQATIANFTDDDERFDAAWAAGYVVATLAEQDASMSDTEGYRADLQQRYAQLLPQARVVDMNAHDTVGQSDSE